jgi:hypothetical protein
MIAPRPQPDRSERWYGHWGADARYYACRSDGAYFEIDGAVNVIDLAGTTPASPHARPVDSLPVVGRYTLSVFAVRPLETSHVKPSIDGPSPIHPRVTTARLLAYGVRRRV